MRDPIHHDLETFSPVSIRDAGAYAYLQHPDTDLLCFAYWLPERDGADIFRAGVDGEPAAFLDAVAAGKPLACWNSGFEWAAWQYLIPRLYPRWPKPKLEQFHDIMAWACAMSLPAKLENVAPALGLAEIKDKEGSRIMRKLSTPRKWLPDGTYTRWTRDDVPADFDRLYEYCLQDVRTEKAVAAVVRPLSNSERDLWLLDQRINDRGIPLDLATVHKAIEVIQVEQNRLNTEIFTATDGAITSATQNKALADWLNKVCPYTTVDSVAKASLRELLDDERTPDVARRVVALRQEAGKTSLAKFPAMLQAAGSTGAAQGAFQYHGATTGRWAGRGTQPQNMPRPKITARDVSAVVDILNSFETADAIRMIEVAGYGKTLDTLSWCLRGMFVPRPGKVWVGGDFSNIEGRVLAWLAGETWKLDAFRAYDAGRGPDLYKLAYAKSFGVDPGSVTDEQRQIGKVQELQLGYQGGVGAFVSSQKQAGWSFDDVADAVFSAADPGLWALAERKRLWLQLEHGMHDWLAPKVYTALRYLTDTWRENNANIKDFWRDLESCALDAVRWRGEVFQTKNGKIAFSCAKSFLYCRLPSGRVLSYPRPAVEMVWNEIAERDEMRVSYWATGKDKDRPGVFSKHVAYGGHFAENVTQAVARDILAEAIKRLESDGFPVVLHVHDEARCEVPEHAADVELVQALMTHLPPWAHGLPIAAGCEVMRRYHK